MSGHPSVSQQGIIVGLLRQHLLNVCAGHDMGMAADGLCNAHAFMLCALANTKDEARVLFQKFSDPAFMEKAIEAYWDTAQNERMHSRANSEGGSA